MRKQLARFFGKRQIPIESQRNIQNEGEGFDPLSVLPQEIVMHTLSFLDGKQVLLVVCRLNKTWNNIANNELLWKSICLIKWKNLDIGRFNGSWKEAWRKNNSYWQWKLEDLVRDEKQDICEQDLQKNAVEFSNNFHTVMKRPSKSMYHTVKGDRLFRKGDGIVYWEIKVDHLGSGSWAKIGVCDEDMKSTVSIGFSENGWGFAGGYKWHMTAEMRSEKERTHGSVYKGLNQPFGRRFQAGDHVGVLLDANRARLYFFLNGNMVGGWVAYSDLPMNTGLYPAVSLNTVGDKFTVNFDVNPPHVDMDLITRSCT